MNRLLDGLEGLIESLAWKMSKECGLDLNESRQEAWLAALEAAECYDGGRSKISTWVYHRVSGRLRDLARRERRRQEMLEPIDPESMPNREEGVVQRLARDLGSDARSVMLAILESPDEILKAGVGKWIRKKVKEWGWGLSRGISAVSELREVFG